MSHGTFRAQHPENGAHVISAADVSLITDEGTHREIRFKSSGASYRAFSVESLAALHCKWMDALEGNCDPAKD